MSTTSHIGGKRKTDSGDAAGSRIGGTSRVGGFKQKTIKNYNEYDIRILEAFERLTLVMPPSRALEAPRPLDALKNKIRSEYYARNL